MSEIDSDEATASMEIDELVLNSPSINSAWTAADKDAIERHIKYHSAAILGLATRLAEGPSKSYRLPCKPESNILNLLRGARPKKASVKSKALSVQKMNAVEFNMYLRGLIVNERDLASHDDNNELLTMSAVADKLNILHKELKKAGNNSLRKAMELGNNLNAAYDKFTAEKRKDGLRDAWKSWIASFTTISESYSRQLRKSADLVAKFPKLVQLGLSYTDFFKLQAKIKSVFAQHIKIGRQWQ
jgi:hypothetical protein